MCEGTRPWADEMRRLFPVRTGRLQFCCETLLSFARRVDVSHLANASSQEIPELALKELCPEMGAACGLISATEGESRSVQGCLAWESWAGSSGAVLFSCSMSPGKHPGAVSKPSTEHWEGRQTNPISSWLSLALGSWTELFGLTGCLVRGSAQ